MCQEEESVGALAPRNMVNDFVRSVRKRVRYITLCESSLDDDGQSNLRTVFFIGIMYIFLLQFVTRDEVV
jgi:hypothetical protein